MSQKKKKKPETDIATTPPMRPALTPEARENQMIYLATQLAEKQLLEGTASSQVITHFLKLGSSKEKLEQAKLEQENLLLKAKTESVTASKSSDEYYAKVIKAITLYSGEGGDDDDEFEY